MEPANAASVSSSPLAKRLIWSAIIIAIAVYLVFFAPTLLYFVGVEIVIFLCLNEFLTLVERKGLPVHRTLGLVFGLLVPLNYFFPIEPLLILAWFVSAPKCRWDQCDCRI